MGNSHFLWAFFVVNDFLKPRATVVTCHSPKPRKYITLQEKKTVHQGFGAIGLIKYINQYKK